ncbi:MAG: IS1595 family transposase, partial [Thauera sp.]
RFDLRALHTRLLVAAATCAPQPQRVIRSAEHHC